MPISRWLMAVALALGALGLSAPAHGQGNEPFVAQEFLHPRLRSGDRIVFCQSSATALGGFERQVAEELAASLLVSAQFHVLNFPFRPKPYDYALGYGETEIFIALVNECDAILGLVLDPDTVPDWMTVTQSYWASRYVLAAPPGTAASLDALGPGARIGTRFASTADVLFNSWLREAAGAGRFDRVPLADFAAELAALCEGRVEAALIWEPALALARQDDPALCALEPIGTDSFTPPAIPFGLGLRSSNAFLRTELDAAIAALRASGTLSAIAAAHGLP